MMGVTWYVYGYCELREDYRNCKVINDKIIVSLNFPVDEWLYSFLFGLVPYVEIIEPSWLREEFIKRLKLSLEKNKL